jgi:hypothetical protein
MWIPALSLLALAPAGYSQDRAAEVLTLRGSAEAVAVTGSARNLRQGSALFPGDRVETGADSALTMRFTDGTRFDLGESSAMSVDAYTYQDNAESNSFSASIFKGVFRFVSGLIAKRRARSMGVRTPVATIGIRGTNVAGEADATSSTIMLLPPEEGDEPSAIEVSNQFGSVTIDEPGFGTEIPDANSPPSPPRRMQLRTIQNLQRTLQSIGRIRPPRIR